ncbi:MAG: hypothetical protein ACFBWO_15285 [Paracoccaceae bacterium]
MERIAIVGWGSLVWELEGLAARVAGDWAMGAGPVLPIEFSRVSRKRLGALTACIDPVHGDDCATHVVRSTRTSVLRAAIDLALRERAPPCRIGLVAPARGLLQGRDGRVCTRLAAWCRETGHDAAVWTDLEPNFEAATGRPFGLGAAADYLAALDGAARASAVGYVEKAPRETDTALRRHLAGLDWWREAAG